MITAREVHDAAFRRAAADTPGYDEVAVDDFLDRVIATLTAIEEGHPSAADAVTSHEVVEIDFPERAADISGGYDMDDVDDLLDRVAQHLFAFENAGGSRHEHSEELPPASELSDDDLGAARVHDRAVPSCRDVNGAADDGGVGDAAALASAAGAPAHGEERVVVVPATPHVEAASTPRDADESRGSLGHDKAHGGAAGGVNPVGAEPIGETATPAQGDSHASAPRTKDVHPVGGDVETGEQQHSAGDVPVVHEQLSEETIISYPATDHRVPLPSHDMRDSFSDEDNEAAAHYHPEFSAYAPPEAPQEPAGASAQANASDPAVDERAASEVPAEPAAAQTDATASTPSPWDAPMSTTGRTTSAAGDDFDPFAVEKAAPAGTQAAAEPASITPSDENAQQGTPRIEALRSVAPANEETAPVREAPDERTASGAPAPVAAELARRAEERRRAAAEPATQPASAHDADVAAGTAETGHVDRADEPAVVPETAQPAPDAVTAQPATAADATSHPVENAPKSDTDATANVERPEPIEAPEPIDAMERPATIEAPKPLPPRKDTSRKGLLRRIFRG